MTKWEYTFLWLKEDKKELWRDGTQIAKDRHGVPWRSVVNQLGNEGWELVSVYCQGLAGGGSIGPFTWVPIEYVFKRPKT